MKLVGTGMSSREVGLGGRMVHVREPESEVGDGSAAVVGAAALGFLMDWMIVLGWDDGR
jgi:hypothetical protein